MRELTIEPSSESSLVHCYITREPAVYKTRSQTVNTSWQQLITALLIVHRHAMVLYSPILPCPFILAE